MGKRHWQTTDVAELFQRPLMELLYEAHSVHRENFNPSDVQVSTLLSIKTGACPEDCKYCSQSGLNKADIDKEKLMQYEQVMEKAKQAKAQGSTRFCMGAAWKTPPKKAMPELVKMIKGVKSLGMEACLTAGMLDALQTDELKQAGLDYYNHNLDTSPEYYKEIITTRSYEDRLQTLENVRNAGINVCCGGILGMGEKQADRIELLCQLANLPKAPESVPINQLVPIAGTPMADAEPLDPFDFVRTIAVARIMMPTSVVRLSAGRDSMSDELQALCFFAGANSIHAGGWLLTTATKELNQDQTLFARLGLTATISNTATEATSCAE